MPEFILAEKDGGGSFKRNFIIYLVNYFFSGPKNCYCNKSILKYVKDVRQIASLDCCQFVLDIVGHYKESTTAKANSDLCAPSFSPTLPLHKPDGEAEIPGDTLVSDASIIIEEEEHCEDVLKGITKKDDSIPSYSLGLRLSQPDSQSPVLQTTSVSDPSTVRVNEDDGTENIDNGAPLRFPLRNTSQLNRELSIKELAENKPNEGDKPSSKKGEVRKQSIKIKKSTLQQPMTGSKSIKQKKGSPRAYDEQEATDSRKPKLIKKVMPKRHDEKCLGAARTPEKLEEVRPSDALKKLQPENLPLAYYLPYAIRLTKLDTELSQDKLTISEYVFGKVEDVDDR
ncbi:hypothetical protein Cgig2_009068 [Carnegiea gigantea]|uniref:Uncharacterized protein n=1 Tax=Carnegiea gigantea TaxID=171969 RepID=A0A9Q1JTH7_9CARY|nr:hypothetical protein Cgig2_009068 [Carnegiea gigantea]